MSSGDVIFLVDSSGSLSELAMTPYESEALLQRLLAENPSPLVGGLRMVFVADTIPIELQRIIEFLNTQLDPRWCSASRYAAASWQ
jgi:hypothetical protein